MSDEYVTFGDVVRSALPGFASGKDVRDGTIQVRMNNVRADGTWDWAKVRRVPATSRQTADYSVAPGDILFNGTNSPELVGKAAVFVGHSEQVLFSNHFLRLRLDEDVADPGYVGRWLTLQWRRGVFERLCTRWVNQAAVRKDDLLDLPLPLPSLDRQRGVRELLSRAERMRVRTERAIELAEGLLEQVFRRQFVDSNVAQLPLETVSDLAQDRAAAIRTGPFGSQLLHSEFTTAGIPVLGIDNVVSNRFEWKRRRFISEAKYEQLRRYRVEPGDVLITIMGTCGRCAIVPPGIGDAVNTKHLCCISLDQDRCLPEYLHGAFLFHPGVRRQLNAATNGAIMDGLNMTIIKALQIPLPPIDQQRRYAHLRQLVERVYAVETEAARQAAELFDALLVDAFAARPRPKAMAA